MSGRGAADPLAEHAEKFIRIAQYLDAVLKRGVVIGVYEDSLEVSDEDIRKALIDVNNLIAETTTQLEKMLRTIARKPLIVVPGSPRLS